MLGNWLDQGLNIGIEGIAFIPRYALFEVERDEYVNMSLYDKEIIIILENIVIYEAFNVLLCLVLEDLCKIIVDPGYVGLSVPWTPGWFLDTSDRRNLAQLSESPLPRALFTSDCADSFGSSDRSCFAQL